MEYRQIESHLRQLQGRILTIIDASYPDGIQRKAVKDLINVQFSRKMSEVSEQSKEKNDKQKRQSRDK